MPQNKKHLAGDYKLPCFPRGRLYRRYRKVFTFTRKNLQNVCIKGVDVRHMLENRENINIMSYTDILTPLPEIIFGNTLKKCAGTVSPNSS